MGFYLVYVNLVMCLRAISMYFFIIAYSRRLIVLVVVDEGMADLGTNSMMIVLS